MADPVQLDFSKAQPLAPPASAGGVTLDFSKAQPLQSPANQALSGTGITVGPTPDQQGVSVPQELQGPPSTMDKVQDWADHSAIGQLITGGGQGMGALKGAAKSVIGADNLIRKGMNLVGGNEQPVDETDFGLNKGDLDTHGILQKTGELGEGVAEWMGGEAGVKALAEAGKLPNMVKSIQFLAEHPTIASAFESAGRIARSAIVGGGEAGVHGQDVVGGAEGGAVGGAAGEAIGAGLNAVSNKIVKSGAKFGVEGPITADTTVPLDSARTFDSPVMAGMTKILAPIDFTGSFAARKAEAVAGLKQFGEKVGDDMGTFFRQPTVTPQQASSFVTDKLAEARNAASSKYGEALQTISNAGASDLPVNVSGSLRQTAQKLLNDIQLPEEFSAGLKDTQGRQQAVDFLQQFAEPEDGSQLTWEQARRLRSQLSAWTNSGDITVGKGALQQMNKALDGEMTQTLNNAGRPDLVKQFRNASSNYADVQNAFETSVIKTLAEKSPDNIADVLLGSNSFVQDVNTLRKTITQNGAKPGNMVVVEQALWQRMLDKASFMDKEGNVAMNPKKMLDSLRKMGPDGMDAAWNVPTSSVIEPGEAPLFNGTEQPSPIPTTVPGTGAYEGLNIRLKPKESIQNLVDVYNSADAGAKQAVFGTNPQNYRNIQQFIDVAKKVAQMPEGKPGTFTKLATGGGAFEIASGFIHLLGTLGGGAATAGLGGGYMISAKALANPKYLVPITNMMRQATVRGVTGGRIIQANQPLLNNLVRAGLAKVASDSSSGQ